MPDQKSVFTPITPEQLQGPFSAFLTPPNDSQRTAAQQPPVNALGGIAMAGTKFLEGVQSARMKSYEKRENEKSQKLTQFNQYITRIVQDPNLTDEAKQYALQQYSKALGGQILGAMGGEKGKGGKKGKQGGEGQQGGVAQHFTNILKDLATGMVGGKMPKGAPDIDLHTIMGEIDAKIYQPQYSKPGIIETNIGNIQSALKALPPGSTQEDALRAITPHLQAVEKVDPRRAQSLRADFLGQYQAAPTVGSPEWAMSQLSKPGEPPSPVGSSGQQPAGGPIGPPPAAPQGAVIPATRMHLAQIAGFAQAPEQFEFVNAEGKREQVYAQVVNIPGGEQGLFDLTGRQIPVDLSKVRKASTAAPRQTRYGTGYVAKDPKKPGQYVRAYDNLDEPGKTIYGASVAPPASTRPRVSAGGGGVASPTQRLAQRKIDALAAISKVLEQTPEPKDAKGQPMSGTALANYYLDHVEKYYKNDPTVKGYMAEIRDWFTTEARKGAFKDPNRVQEILANATGQAQQAKAAADTQQHMDAMQQQLDNLTPEVRGAVEDILGSSDGGGTSYDDVMK